MHSVRPAIGGIGDAEGGYERGEEGKRGLVEGGQEEVEVEEGRPAKMARDPGCPTEAERKAHEASHLPFRSWCGPCVLARMPNLPHKRIEREESGVPEVGMDYGFMSRKGDKTQMTVLVTKDRDTKVIMANVVLRKGSGMEETVDQGTKNIRRLGHNGRMGIKVDNEPALIDLRNSLMRKREEPTVPIQPPKGESQSNGAIENAVRLVKEMIRVHTIALERKIDGTVPTHHPVMSWIVEHAADMITKYMVGKDGKTGFERLLGRPCREEGLEFGERVYFRRRKGPMPDMEARWREGIWLGRRWGTIDHLVFDGEAAVEARAVHRRPETERWDKGDIEKVTALPWKWRVTHKREGQVEVIPPRTEEEKSKDKPEKNQPGPEQVPPKSVYIQPTDLDKYGYTKGCRRCQLMREKKKAHGIRHSAECRNRLEERMKEDQDDRVQKADIKKDEYVAEMYPELEEKGGGGDQQQGSSSSSSGTIHGQEVQAQTLPAGEPVNVEMAVEDLGEDDRLRIGSLLRRCRDVEAVNKELPAAIGLYELLLASGAEGKVAWNKIVEVYSPPRVGAAARKYHGFNLLQGMTFDLIADENGRSWDFIREQDRKRAREAIRREKPYIVIGSPPCTDYTTLNQNVNHPRMHPEEVRRRMIVARTHLDFVVQIYCDQLKEGRHFLHEHPASAASWKEESMKWLGGRRRVESVIAHMCPFGMKAKAPDGSVGLVLKPTRWMSSASELLKHIARRCTGDHHHTKLEGARRTSQAAIYPEGLCVAILEGIVAQKRREGQALPGGVAEAVDKGVGVVDLEPKEEIEKVRRLAMKRRMRDLKAVEAKDEEFRDWEGEKFWEEDTIKQGGGYIDDITGAALPIREAVAARWEEIEFMRGWKVWEEVTTAECHRRTGKGPLGGRWVDHNKGDRDSPVVRCRYVAQEVAHYKDDSLFAATPPLEALRMIISDAATTGKEERKVLLVDVRKAHLHAEAIREVFVQLPPEIRRPGYCARLKRCLYGTRDAASRWEALYAARLEGMGFQRGRASACCFHNEALGVKCVVHGDDFTFSGDDKALDVVEKKMQEAFLCKVEGRLGSATKDLKEARVLGRIIRWTKDGFKYEADPRHVEMLVRDLGVGEAKPLSSPGVKCGEGGVEGEEPLGEEETRRYRGAAARANYLGQDRADIAYPAKECCRRMAQPRKKDWDALVRIARYLKGKPRVVYDYPWQRHEQLMTYVDTDFAGCLATCRSTSGGCAMRGRHLIKHWSSTQKTVTLSSGEAELAGLVKGSAEGLGLASLGLDLGIELSLTVRTDSSAAVGICRRSGIGRVRHLAVGQLWVQERIKNGDFTLEKFPGPINPADLLTKFLDQQTIRQHVANAGLYEEAGRPKSAPRIV